jgi:hypothetical protein
VQLDPIKPTLKAPGISSERKKLKYDKPLSILLHFKLRRYTTGSMTTQTGKLGRAGQVDPIKPTLKAPGT